MTTAAPAPTSIREVLFATVATYGHRDPEAALADYRQLLVKVYPLLSKHQINLDQAVDRETGMAIIRDALLMEGVVR